MRRNFEFVKKMYDEYLKGNTQRELDNKYNTDSFYHFKKNGLVCRSIGETLATKRSNKIKLNYIFDKVKEPNDSYILGFLYADGWVGKTQTGLRLKSSDVDILLKIKDYFSEDITLQKNNTSRSFVISSKKVVNNLNKLGLNSKKTHLEFSIPKIPNNLISHFMRGYFDGDGSVFICKSGKNRYLKCYICSPTKTILEDFQKELLKNNIDCSINKENRIGKLLPNPNGYTVGTVDMYRLFIRKKSEIKKFYNYLYNNSEMKMERKYLKFKDNLHLLKKLK